jgi:hypothetical protein
LDIRREAPSYRERREGRESTGDAVLPRSRPPKRRRQRQFRPARGRGAGRRPSPPPILARRRPELVGENRATRGECNRDCLDRRKRLGLIGTGWLIESRVYSEKLEAQGLAYVRPHPSERNEINRIMEELVCGNFKSEAIAYHQQGNWADEGRGLRRVDPRLH